MARGLIRIGCAGWALRKESADAYPPPGTHLERYARHFNAVEINSSFYRPHRRGTYERWGASVPADFRFAVKVPKAVTHAARLADTKAALERFLGEAGGLGDKLGPLLIQLPPRLAFDASVAGTFFATLRQLFAGDVVCEPRHAAWFGGEAARLFRKFHVARADADPPPAAATEAADFGHVRYYRLHGSPRMYYSAYTPESLAALATRLQQTARSGREVWCIFDNTAAGAALDNALQLQSLVEPRAD
ncbi:MAG: DUF72 domain-containing protein [Hyphomicrobium sp.]|uniref:DUF72 domain-containing protein n=1 Tax=Hyphomicrobium sp. TaxID=82 RepID=UPI0013276543|nr:DUF72 domain-containing protein [Hyphomicrobium sp.]KAB2941257.1 MAG: DUF72 domain-containing protein [Hyphomicrobium sp.]MBZ0209147.1 DUF72 domain-containing protein [Hyphomicrobium sp.]